MALFTNNRHLEYSCEDHVHYLTKEICSLGRPHCTHSDKEPYIRCNNAHVSITCPIPIGSVVAVVVVVIVVVVAVVVVVVVVVGVVVVESY
jgi:hypothetical protein